MLTDTKKMLDKARDGGYAVGAFNAENAEMVFAIVAAAEKCKAPVILQMTPSTLRYLPPACFAGLPPQPPKMPQYRWRSIWIMGTAWIW